MAPLCESLLLLSVTGPTQGTVPCCVCMWLPKFGGVTELFAPIVQPVLLIDDNEVVAEFQTLSGKARPGEQCEGKKSLLWHSGCCRVRYPSASG